MTAHALQRRLNLELALAGLPPFAWTVAATFALARLATPRFDLALTLAAALVALLFFARHTWRRRWTTPQAAVLLDRLADAGGLSLALAEARGAEWRAGLDAKLARARPPRFAAGRPTLFSLAALAFAVAVSFVRPMPDARATPLDTAAAERIADLAREERALAAEKLDEANVAKEIAQLKADLDGNRFDAVDWEAADSTSEQLREAAEERGRELAKAAADAKALAEKTSSEADAEAMARDQEALDRELSKLGDEAPSQGRSDAGKQGTKSRAESLDELRKSLDARRGALSKAFGHSPGHAKSNAGSQPNHEPNSSDSSGRANGQSGVGGPAHGPARDTPLRFGDETPAQKHRLEPDALPQSSNPQDPSELVGVKRDAPKVDADGSIAAPSSAAAGADAPGLSDQPVPPRAREAVRRYFDTDHRGPP